MKHYTGNQHSINWQTYCSDDEPDFDLEPELDAVAFEEWIIEQTDAGLIGDCKFMEV